MQTFKERGEAPRRNEGKGARGRRLLQETQAGNETDVVGTTAKGARGRGGGQDHDRSKR